MWNNDRPTGSNVIPSTRSQPKSSQSTLERVSNNHSKGNTPQPTIVPNTTIDTATPKTMNSYDLDSLRGSQHTANVPQPPSRDVTRVVKILKQNEPLVRKCCNTRQHNMLYICLNLGSYLFSQIFN